MYIFIIQASSRSSWLADHLALLKLIPFLRTHRRNPHHHFQGRLVRYLQVDFALVPPANHLELLQVNFDLPRRSQVQRAHHISMHCFRQEVHRQAVNQSNSSVVTLEHYLQVSHQLDQPFIVALNCQLRHLEDHWRQLSAPWVFLWTLVEAQAS